MLYGKFPTSLTGPSDASHIAETAALFAERSNAKLSIVHVLEHTPIVYGGGEFSIPLDISLEEQLTKSARLALASLAKKVNIADENQHIAHGSVKREVIELAGVLAVDLIVVGTHGHSGMEVLLGSTANAILHAAKCDVLTVRVNT